MTGGTTTKIPTIASSVSSIYSNFAYTPIRHHAHFVSQASFLSPERTPETFPACLRLICFMLYMQRTAI